MYDEEELRKLLVRIEADVNGYVEELERADNATEKVFNTIENLGVQIANVGIMMQAAGTLLTATVTAPLTAVGSYSLYAFEAQDKAERTLRGVVEANERNAQVLLADYKRFATELQKVTTQSDEVTFGLLKMAQGMGLVGRSAKTAVKEALGLSTAFDISAGSAMEAVAALDNANTKMLEQYIPTLREIEDPIERVEEAHRALARLFPMAEEDAESFSGSLRRLWNEIKNLAEMIGELIEPYITPLVSWLVKAVKWVKNLDPGLIKLGVAIGAIAAAIGPVLMVLGGLISALGVIALNMPLITSALAAIPGLIAAVAPVVLVVVGVLGGLALGIWAFRDAIAKVFSWAKEQFDKILKYFGTAIEGITASLKAGDLIGAWEILWVEVKIQFFKAIKDVEEVWATFLYKLETGLVWAMYKVGMLTEEGYKKAIRVANKKLLDDMEKIDKRIKDLIELRDALVEEAKREIPEMYIPELDEEEEPPKKLGERIKPEAITAIRRGTVAEQVLKAEHRFAMIAGEPSREKSDSANIRDTAKNTKAIQLGVDDLVDTAKRDKRQLVPAELGGA